MTLLQKLTTWQKAQARKEGIEGYRVLPFKTLQAIAQFLPKTPEDLLAISGIGPVKVKKYGRDILAMVAGKHVRDVPIHGVTHSDLLAQADLFREADEVHDMLADKVAAFVGEDMTPQTPVAQKSTQEKPAPQNIDTSTGEVLDQDEHPIMSVSDFLMQVNSVLGSYFSQIKVRGEIIGFKRNANGHAYFEIKDDHAIVRVSVFNNVYHLSGVALADGMEVIITGTPEHHARFGFSVIGSFVEIAGAGALKKAYDKLKKQLQAEGLFDVARKRSLPALPQRIGLITSPTGAAIGDFTMNIGSYGYQIFFYPSRVEGAQAVKELLGALDILAKKDVDLLVITRGGGSLESLAAFNNENIVRALAEFPVPVVAGIGHEQDETLCTLVADVGVSTPTAAARAVRESWDHAVAQLDIYAQQLQTSCDQVVRDIQNTQRESMQAITEFFAQLREQSRTSEHVFSLCIERLGQQITTKKHRLDFLAQSFAQHNPLRLLKQGYSIVRTSDGTLVRSTSDVKKDAILKTHVHDGTINSRVI